MKFARIIFIVSCLCILLNGQLSGQVLAGSRIHGSFETLAQVYRADSAIGAAQPQEVFLSNSYFNLSYTLGNFTAGVRFEAYLNTLEGYPNPENLPVITYSNQEDGNLWLAYDPIEVIPEPASILLFSLGTAIFLRKKNN